ncbi:MAG TPA: lipid A deacylase LpxR family protein [Cellvibrionaceae bacterium]
MNVLISTVMIIIFLASGWAPLALAENSASTGKQVWAVSMDNDFLVPLSSSDRDFTGGMALTYSAESGAQYWRPVDGLLGKIDRALTRGTLAKTAATTSFELGFYGFTPGATEQAHIVENDRPYASLIYASASRMYLLENGGSLSTALTLGVLGTDLVGSAQSDLHKWLDNKPVEGWHNQISDGGELTARYQMAYHHYWNSERSTARYKTTVFTSAGYLTEVGVALSTRRGLIRSADHRFNPELISYGERVNDAVATPWQGRESYFWGGIALKARLYNAFLQGQFRHSAHTLDYNDLRPLIAEAWLGYTFTIGQQYKASYVLRAQSSELKGGPGDRTHVWGGIVLSRSL